ncbi:phosphotransferase [Tenggerimyces flavus]|uniref:Phosphotransferase n=1 Tax=Tenggerimyces flavus TaxID=1708749 RepID=A0ABV7YG32_9ACTN|nr:phosphotransferase [Tenggerimyces flavus]MBM7783907.1 hypothetical protein [Tenggerimyces flavus]
MTNPTVVPGIAGLPAWAAPDGAELAAMVRGQLGRPNATVVNWWIEEVDYEIGTPVTARLTRVRGTARDGEAVLRWSFFVKELQSFRLWPPYERVSKLVPDFGRFDGRWRFEADVYESDLHHALPPGLRLPKVYATYEHDDLRTVVWSENVETAQVDWDIPRYQRAARLLGQLSARLTRHDLYPETASRVPGEMTRLYVTTRLEAGAFEDLFADSVWEHPLLEGTGSLRADLERLAARVPELLGVLDTLPQTFMHGDASPQNLLVPKDNPQGFVVIDWTMAGLVAVGYDLGQLLVGHAHAGLLDAAELPALHDEIAVAHAQGLAMDGFPVDLDELRCGFDAQLVIRSAFTALPLGRLREPASDKLADLVESRLALTRYLVDLGLALPDRLTGSQVWRS